MKILFSLSRRGSVLDHAELVYLVLYIVDAPLTD